MALIQMKDGSFYPLNNEQDSIDAVRKFAGDELADYIQEVLWEAPENEAVIFDLQDEYNQLQDNFRKLQNRLDQFQKKTEVLEGCVGALEKKIQIMNETFRTLQDMEVSEQMAKFIQNKSRTIHLIDLINSTSGQDQGTINLSQEKSLVTATQDKKQNLDQRIAGAVQNAAVQAGQMAPAVNQDEDPRSVLKISLEPKSEGSWYYNRSLTNCGTKVYADVKIRATFQNPAGQTIDTNTKYIVSSDGLYPNESKKFSIYAGDDPQIVDCVITIIKWEEKEEESV